MSKEITLIYNSLLFLASPTKLAGEAYVWITPQSSPNFTSRFDTDVNIWALVLDRKDPSKELFSAKIDGNSEPPAALQALMTPDNILIYMSAGSANAIPQGNLYTMLKDNGAGAYLEKLEALALFNGSGMTGSILYSLVTIPGSNMPGIEKLTTGLSGTTTYPDTSGSIYVYGYLSSVIKLVPGSNGYAPILVA